THFLHCLDRDFQCAGSVWDGVEFDGVSAGGGARWRMVAARHASVCTSHVAPFVVGWDGVSESLLKAGGARRSGEVGICGRNGGWKFSCILDWGTQHFCEWIVRLVGSGAWADGDFGD